MTKHLHIKRVLFALLFCAIFIQSNARTLPETVLDQATVSVYYQFTQQASIGATLILLTDTTVLRIGSIYSVYYNRSSIQRDSIHSATFSSIDVNQIQSVSVFRDASHIDLGSTFDNIIGGLDFTQQSNPQNTRIFKNRQMHTITSIDGTLPGTAVAADTREMFLVEETIPPQEWTILSDTMTVLNYLCFKATTTFRGRNYIAWFTLDIPINDGPWKVYGLPGLILRLEDEDGLFVHEAIGLTSHAERPIVINEGTYTIATNEQLQRWIENRRRMVQRTVFSRGNMTIMGMRNELNLNRREIGD